MFIENKGAQLYTVTFGSGPHTILAHGGWIGSWELWTEPFAYLSKTWRTVAYDHRGSGVTMAPVDSITMENMVSDIFAVMDCAGRAASRLKFPGEQWSLDCMLQKAENTDR